MGGTHPDANATCNDLIAANGNIAAIPPQLEFCPAFFDPTTVSASGSWRGFPLNYSKNFSNPCYADVSTGGHVFHF